MTIVISLQAYGLPSYYVNLIPFVPLLTDAEPCNITVDIAPGEPDHTTDSNCIVSASLRVFLANSELVADI